MLREREFTNDRVHWAARAVEDAVGEIYRARGKIGRAIGAVAIPLGTQFAEWRPDPVFAAELPEPNPQTLFIDDHEGWRAIYENHSTERTQDERHEDVEKAVGQLAKLIEEKDIQGLVGRASRDVELFGSRFSWSWADREQFLMRVLDKDLQLGDVAQLWQKVLQNGRPRCLGYIFLGSGGEYYGFEVFFDNFSSAGKGGWRGSIHIIDDPPGAWQQWVMQGVEEASKEEWDTNPFYSDLPNLSVSPCPSSPEPEPAQPPKEEPGVVAPAGETILYVSDIYSDPAQVPSDLDAFEVSPDGSNRRQLDTASSSEVSPVALVGERIYLVSGRDGGGGIYSYSAPKQPEPFFLHKGLGASLAQAPDGTLAASLKEHGKAGILLINPDNPDASTRFESPYFDDPEGFVTLVPVFSPDGKTLAVAKIVGRQFELFGFTRDGQLSFKLGPFQGEFGGGEFTPDGLWFVHVVGNPIMGLGYFSGVLRVPIDGSSPREGIDFPQLGNVYSISISPDGKRYVVSGVYGQEQGVEGQIDVFVVDAASGEVIEPQLTDDEATELDVYWRKLPLEALPEPEPAPTEEVVEQARDRAILVTGLGAEDHDVFSELEKALGERGLSKEQGDIIFWAEGENCNDSLRSPDEQGKDMAEYVAQHLEAHPQDRLSFVAHSGGIQPVFWMLRTILDKRENGEWLHVNPAQIEVIAAQTAARGLGKPGAELANLIFQGNTENCKIAVVGSPAFSTLLEIGDNREESDRQTGELVNRWRAQGGRVVAIGNIWDDVLAVRFANLPILFLLRGDIPEEVYTQLVPEANENHILFLDRGHSKVLEPGQGLGLILQEIAPQLP